MLVQDFYSFLRKHKSPWVYRRDPGRTGPQQCIRTKCNNTWFCPVTYVAYKLTGKRYNIYEVDKAGQSIQLKTRDRQRLVEAADYALAGQTRKKLLEAVNLPH